MKTITIHRSLEAPYVARSDLGAPPGEYVDRATVDELVARVREVLAAHSDMMDDIVSDFAHDVSIAAAGESIRRDLLAALAPFAPPEASRE